jgi:hypothetical protein
MGDIPIATLRPNGSGVNLYYAHTDHLNIPRRISRPSDNAMLWRWDSDPFGITAANDDCDEITRDIYDAMNVIRQRIGDLLTDRCNLFQLAMSVPTRTCRRDAPELGMDTLSRSMVGSGVCAR